MPDRSPPSLVQTLHGDSANPVPDGAIVEAILTGDGVSLRAARWPKTGVASCGTICLVQGRAECIEKYFETVADLRRRGFAVVTFDWRGQGGSERQLSNARKGHVDSFELYIRDLDAILLMMERHCPRPWFALAHSMGATALLLALERGERRFERAALSSPMVKLANIGFPATVRALAAGLDGLGFGGRFIPGGTETSISTKGFEGNRLSGDRERYLRNAAIVLDEPRLGIGDPTVSWVHSAFRAMSELADPAFGSRFATPTLMIYGSTDRLCSAPAVAELGRRLRLCASVEIVGARHEPLMESEALRQRFLAAFDAFIPGELRSSIGPRRQDEPAQAVPDAA